MFLQMGTFPEFVTLIVLYKDTNSKYSLLETISNQIIFTINFGDDWYRQERSPVCKHVGARLFTPLLNDDQHTNGDNNFALAA